MAPGTTINTGDGRVDIELRDGAGKTNRESGDITLRDITAGTINAVNYGAAAASGITLASGTLAARASSGSSIVLAGRDFDNSTGGVLSTSGTARWLVYSESPGTTIKGGLTSEFRHYNGSSSNYAPDRVHESGNGFIYSSAPGTVSVSTTLAGGSASSVYGSTPTATYGFTLTSSDNEDTIGNIGLTGSMIVTGVPTATSNAGSYTISYGGGLSSSIGLTFTAGTGLKYTVEKRAINISANALSKTYGDTDQTLTWMAEERSMSRGLIPGDSFNGTLGRAAGENIGVYAINQGTLGNSNYAISYSGNNLTINPRPISFCATPTGKIYGESDPKLAVDITSGSLGSETVSDTLGDVTGILTRQSGSSVGSYDIALGSGRKAKNYAVTFETGNDAFSITKRPITITADDKSKTYSITDPKLTWQAETKSSGRGVLSGDSFSGTLERTAGENVGTYEITQGSLDNTNYAITLIGADFTINQRPPTLTVANAPVTINPPSGETLSNTVEPTTGTTSRISGVQQASMHETGNANFNREFVRKTLSINAAPFVTTCDLPETSNGLWSEKLSATSGFVAVTSIEVHEPAMEFFIVPIPHGTFRHHNPEAILTLEVRLVNGLSLPAWMSFDPKLKVLSGTPPQEAKGEYPVELIAKDQFGGVARTVLLVKVG